MSRARGGIAWAIGEDGESVPTDRMTPPPSGASLRPRVDVVPLLSSRRQAELIRANSRLGSVPASRPSRLPRLLTPAWFRESSAERDRPSARRAMPPLVLDDAYDEYDAFDDEANMSVAAADRSAFASESAATRRDISPALLSGRSEIPKSSSRSVMQSDRKPATIKLGTYTGSNMPLETHLAKLRNCNQYYGWSATDRLCHLKSSLESTASTLLWELSDDCTEQDLIELLRTRFGDREQIERYRFELKTRRRKPGESLQSLHNDICRLLALSYPGESGSLSRVVARDAFLDSLGDPELRVKILEKEVDSLEQAFALATRFEAFRAGIKSDDADHRRCRVANSKSDASAPNLDWKRQMESAVYELREGMRFLSQQCAGSLLPSMRPQYTAPVVAAPVDENQGFPRPPSVAQVVPANQTSAMHPSMARGNRGLRRMGPCFKCGEVGHIARNCSFHRKQVRTTIRACRATTG
jgi:hypothetical protein